MATRQGQRRSGEVYQVRAGADPALNQDINAILTRLTSRLDQLEGRNGTPTFYSHVDFNGQRLKNLANPSDPNSQDAAPMSQALTLGASGAYDANGITIVNAAAGVQSTDVVNVSQLADIEDAFKRSIPGGIIVMWSGAAAAIPSGWALCDGTLGTPDLRNRFVIGAGSTYNPGDTGGASSLNLAHTHSDGTYATDSQGAHAHTADGTLASAASASATTTVDNDLAASTVAVASANHTHDVTGNTSSDGAHTHDVTGASGSSLSSPTSILNPYYALCFIMRL